MEAWRHGMSTHGFDLGDRHAGFTAQLATSVLDIDRADWDGIWPFPDEGYDYYRVQEEAGIAGVRFGYLILREGDGIVLLAPLFITGFDIGLALPDRLRGVVARIQRLWPSFLVFNSLFCGGPTVDRGVIACAPGPAGPAALLAAFDAALSACARRVRAWMIILKDLEPGSLRGLDPLFRHGFVRTPALPMPVLDTRYASLEAYVATRSPGMRKDLRRKARRSDRLGGLEVVETERIDGLEDAVADLYRRTANRSADQLGGHLTPAYFRDLGRRLPGRVLYLLYYVTLPEGRRLIGFNLCMRRDGALVDKYIGMDYELSREHSLYFTSFLRNIEWCIAHGVGTYVLNYGSEELKARLGARMEERWHLSRLASRILNRIGLWFTPASAVTPFAAMAPSAAAEPSTAAMP